MAFFIKNNFLEFVTSFKILDAEAGYEQYIFTTQSGLSLDIFINIYEGSTYISLISPQGGCLLDVIMKYLDRIKYDNNKNTLFLYKDEKQPAIASIILDPLQITLTIPNT